MSEQVPTRPSAIAIANLERQLKVAQQITHIGSWEWDAEHDVITWSDELYRIYGLPVGTPITLPSWLEHIYPDDRARLEQTLAEALRRGGRYAWSERIVRQDGEIRELDCAGEVMLAASAGGGELKPARVVGTCRDVTGERVRERMLARIQRLEMGERRALEMLASGAPLADILGTIARLLEELLPASLVSIQTMDTTGTRIRHAAAPSLPAAFNAAIDNAPIGPAVGSCGTAAFRRERVIVDDIEHSPLWAPYLGLTRPHGLRACWSSPLIGSDGAVLGTFAVYYREPRAPDDAALDLVSRASHVAGICIERRQLDDRMRALGERIESIREDERTRIAREVHDELGQSLTALKMDISWVARRLSRGDCTPEPSVETKLAEMTRATDEIIGVVRRISAELRPGILDDLGLEAAIEWLVDDFAKRTGIAGHVVSHLGDLRLSRDVSTTVFRICQEALTNVTRHARATRVDVRLETHDGVLEVEIGDDGIGVPERAQVLGSLGLLGMRERARRLGGDCEVRRRSPTGTLVAVQVPVRTAAARD